MLVVIQTMPESVWLGAKELERTVEGFWVELGTQDLKFSNSLSSIELGRDNFSWSSGFFLEL
jgi:hypothetical protein